MLCVGLEGGLLMMGGVGPGFSTSFFSFASLVGVGGLDPKKLRFTF
jgi:hypothetical protein